MGADFLVVTALVSDKTKDEVIGRIDKMPADELLNLADYMGYDDMTPDDVRGTILDAVNAIVDTDGREYATIQCGDTWVYVTGGMSWGDTPTDAFDEIWLLHESSITDDDYWKSRE